MFKLEYLILVTALVLNFTTAMPFSSSERHGVNVMERGVTAQEPASHKRSKRNLFSTVPSYQSNYGQPTSHTDANKENPSLPHKKQPDYGASNSSPAQKEQPGSQTISFDPSQIEPTPVYLPPYIQHFSHGAPGLSPPQKTEPGFEVHTPSPGKKGSGHGEKSDHIEEYGYDGKSGHESDHGDKSGHGGNSGLGGYLPEKKGRFEFPVLPAPAPDLPPGEDPPSSHVTNKYCHAGTGHGGVHLPPGEVPNAANEYSHGAPASTESSSRPSQYSSPKVDKECSSDKLGSTPTVGAEYESYHKYNSPSKSQKDLSSGY